MTISIIVAASNNNAIGANNQLLWHLPNDLKYFKNTTWGMPVIMGRKTFESVNKPLPGRVNIVITRQKNWVCEGVLRAADLAHALELAAETNCKEAFIIGGGEIYSQALPMAECVYLTRVNTEIEGDTFFPTLDAQDWTLEKEEAFLADARHPFDYNFQTWVRKTDRSNF